MKIAAIIAEYNPFHRGHKFHIEETKKIADAVNVPFEQITYERIGETVGTHTAQFSSPFDEITLTHKAINRDLFAQSALHIACWLMKCDKGFYTMSDYAKFKLKEHKK